MKAIDKEAQKRYTDARRKQLAQDDKTETIAMRRKRIEQLKSDFVLFAKYYFPHLMDSEFGWFHLKAVESVKNKPKGWFCFEFPREHAKSVFTDIMLTMWLYARNELTGCILASSSQAKAKVLVGDIKDEFETNERLIADFGNQKSFDWASDFFATVSGVGFWALGRGQSARGLRVGANRPNLTICDDLDDDEIVKNTERCYDASKWVQSSLWSALKMQGGRLIVIGNRIHSHSILAHLVGDLDDNCSKRNGLTHIKVFATEHPVTHERLEIDDPNSVCAWKERYTKSMLLQKWESSDFEVVMQENYHETVAVGKVFKPEHLVFVPRLLQYEHIIFYGDPSYKETATSDYKAIAGFGVTPAKKLHLIYIWCRITSVAKMVSAFRHCFEQYGDSAQYHVEANFIQDIFLKPEFEAQDDGIGIVLPIRYDRDAKGDKITRIGNMVTVFERGLIEICDDLRDSSDFKTFKNQLLGFPTYKHDDAPDAMHGAYSKIQSYLRIGKAVSRTGKYNKNNNR
jgi:predicted phage terminase large subunit-like protein